MSSSKSNQKTKFKTKFRKTLNRNKNKKLNCEYKMKPTERGEEISISFKKDIRKMLRI